jgi:hypothetical protein
MDGLKGDEVGTATTGYYKSKEVEECVRKGEPC